MADPKAWIGLFPLRFSLAGTRSRGRVKHGGSCLLVLDHVQVIQEVRNHKSFIGQIVAWAYGHEFNPTLAKLLNRGDNKAYCQ